MLEVRKAVDVPCGTGSIQEISDTIGPLGLPSTAVLTAVQTVVTSVVNPDGSFTPTPLVTLTFEWTDNVA